MIEYRKMTKNSLFNRLESLTKKSLLAMLSAGCCLPAALQANDKALPVEAANFDPAGSVTVTRSELATNPVMDIDHHVDKTVLDWASFDIGRDSTVNFNQLNSSSLTLNRIHQMSASQIFGQLNANGRIFLINQNGILFGEGSQVNVHELTASTLNITDEVFEEGILSAIKSQEAAFSLFTDADGNPLPSETIIIESGAELNTDSGGRIFIFAPAIENNGIIRTPDGQTILAAGEKVYLQASDDPNLRGLLVEVDSGGEVLNLGEIVAERGNATLIGKTINQNNRITATTSISANGSIRLLARDTVEVTNSFGTTSMVATETGELNLGQNSVTEILAELDSDAKAVDDQIQFKSRVELMGEKIHLKEDSLISARGGEVDISAVEDPSQTQPNSTVPIAKRDNVIVQIESGSRIDVSGNSTTEEMSRNNIEVELRGNELKDLPLQRDGALRGETVVVDVRKADEFQMGDISGNLGTIERNVAERTSVGGTVKINSEGDVRFLEGAEIDVSGGQINFKAGKIKTTILDAGLSEVDIHEADPNRVYAGVKRIDSYDEAAYVEGKDAGTVQIAGHSIIADGSFKGDTVAGRYQRTASNRPMGGRLMIGLPDGQGIEDFRAPNITLQALNLADSNGAYSIGINGSFVDAGLNGFENELLLSTDFLTEGGFNRVEINSNGNITLAENNDLNLDPLAEVTFRGDSVNINSSISSASGDFEFVSSNVNSQINISTAPAGLFINDNVVLDVSGNWTNDFPSVAKTGTPVSPIMLDGGSISLSAEVAGTELSLGDSVGLITMGGARRDQSGDLEYGKGGDVSISLDNQNIALNTGKDNYILGHGSAGGGKLSINTNGISIENMNAAEWLDGQSVAAGGTTKIADFIFSDSGFSEFEITSNQGDVVVQSGANIELKNSGLFLPFSALTAKSGSLSSLLSKGDDSVVLPYRQSDLASDYLDNVTTVLPWLNSKNYTGFKQQYLRGSQQLTLGVRDTLSGRRSLVLAEDSMINADPGASLELVNGSGGLINIDGAINAPAADINILLQRRDDQPFDASHAVVIGEHGSINAGGAVVAVPDPNGLKRGLVFDAGNVSITSSGYIVTDEDSEIDVSGISAELDVTGGVTTRTTTRKTINADAGSISFRAGEGIIEQGSLNLAAANNNNAFGGSLEYQLDRTLRGNIETGIVFPEDTPEIQIRQESVSALPDSFSAGDNIAATNNGKVYISADKIADSAADQLNLKNDFGEINFVGDSVFNLRRDIILDSPVLSSDGGNVDLNSNYVSLGSSARASRNASLDPDPVAGTGVINVNANLIDLVGLTTVQDIGTLNLNSTGDIRFRGVSNQVRGEFSMVGDINLTADQIYPTTMTSFTLDAGDTGTIAIHSGDGNGGTVLSAGGDLLLHAGDIIQEGVIRAPFGQITLDAENSLVLGAGSETSVSADGQSILLGQTLNGTEWLYSASGSLQNAQTLYSASQQNVPEKKILLQSDDIDFMEDAVVDLSGGGELINWEFVPGPGGSRDFLLAENAGNFFAVVPGLNSGFAAYDAQEFNGWDLQAGESVYLSGGNGLAAGHYAKLPARYALLPGAFLIEAVDGFNHLPTSQQISVGNGTLVAGTNTISGTSIEDSSTSGFVIRPGTYANQLSEFNVGTADEIVNSIADANDFALPRLSGDAGLLSITGNNRIDLNGSIKSAADAGARGALVDISADNLKVVNDVTGIAGVVELKASSLSGLGVESLLIGANRNFTTEGTELDVQSDSVEIESGVDLLASEVLLVAKEDIQINSGSSISSSGEAIEKEERLLLDGDSGLVRVSTATQVDVLRTGSPTGSASLNLADGSVLNSDNSVTVDSSGSVTLDAEVNIAEGGSLHLGASEISIGDTTSDTGLVLDDAKLAEIAGQDLVLRSTSAINFFGTADIVQKNLKLDTVGLIADEVGVEEVSISAEQISFRNLSGQTPPPLTTIANGQLDITASEMILDEGTFTIDGFETVTTNIQGGMTAINDSTLDIKGDLNFAVAQIGAGSGVDTNISATGHINLLESGAVAESGIENAIGASFNVEGASVTLDTTIDIPVGNINVRATDGDVVVGSHSNIDVSGESIDVLGLSEITLPGGNVTLVSDAGNVEIQEGSLIDVTSGGVGSATGQVNLIAEQGDVSVKGHLEGSFPQDENGVVSLEKGGFLKIDATSIGQSLNPDSQHSFEQLNASLQKGGFTGGIDILLREGDINVAGIVLAQNIKLTADKGSIGVSGALLTADDEQGGLIELIADQNLTLDTGAFLSAAPLDVNAENPEGGTIFLQATNGVLDLNQGTEIQAGLAGVGEEGTVHLRAPRVASNDEVNVQDLKSTILAARDINIEAVKVFDSISNINSTVMNNVQNDADGFMNNASAIETRLGVDGDDRYRLQAGIELRNDGDMTLANDWDLSGFRPGGETGVLTLRATGDVTFNGDLSDGVETKLGGSPFNPTETELPMDDESWSFNIVAGSDKTNGSYSADHLRVSSSSDADFTLADDKLVRTGTGNIVVRAADDVVLSNSKSTIYTLGRKSGFELDHRKEGANFGGFATDTDVRKLVPVDGGDLSIVAGNDIVGPGTEHDQTQLFVEWYKRQNHLTGSSFGTTVLTVDEDAGTWIDFGSFEQGVAAFGGGDININAGNDIVRLSVSAPSTITSDFDTEQVNRFGEGNVNVVAKGDIEGGIFFVGDGQADINVGGDIVSGRRTSTGTPLIMDTVFALMGGDLNVNAIGNIDVEAIYNPTTVFETNVPLFVTYDETTAASLKSISGNITVDPGTTDIQNNTLKNFSQTGGPFRTMPGTLRLAAVEGDINLKGGELDLLPATQGNLELYAKNNINAEATFIMSDAPLSLIPDINNPVTTVNALNLMVSRLQHAEPALHAEDSVPSWIVAEEGSIDGGVFFLPEQVRLSAGRDILDIRLSNQNINASDITRIEAGRDIVLTGSNNVIGLSGPGRLEVMAGRNIDLGPSIGIETRGDLLNGVLADQGADVFVMAGVGEGPQYQQFYTDYFADDSEYHQNLIDFLNGRFDSDTEVQAFLAQSDEEQWAEISEEFSPEIIDAFYAELEASVAVIDGSIETDYSRGFGAIDVLFPESHIFPADNGSSDPIPFKRSEAYDPAKLAFKLAGESNEEYFARLEELSDYKGDLGLFFSKIYTLDGGDINTIVPGGFINAGLASAPANAPQKEAGELGVVAQSFGSIRSMSRGDFQVNQSRVSTLLGGPIVLWSSTGNIDAGRGSKTAVSAPEPRITITDSGEIEIDLSNTISGSGIRALSTRTGIAPGDVALITPNGFVDAGDAGIGGGNITIPGPCVGCDNIDSIGIVISPGLGDSGSVSTGGLTGGGDVASAASKSAENAAQEDSQAGEEEEIEEEPQLTFISVEVLGFGEEEDA